MMDSSGEVEPRDDDQRFNRRPEWRKLTAGLMQRRIQVGYQCIARLTSTKVITDCRQRSSREALGLGPSRIVLRSLSGGNPYQHGSTFILGSPVLFPPILPRSNCHSGSLSRILDKSHCPRQRPTYHMLTSTNVDLVVSE